MYLLDKCDKTDQDCETIYNIVRDDDRLSVIFTQLAELDESDKIKVIHR